MKKTDYTRPIPTAVLARMLGLLASGPATTRDLLIASGKSAPRARDYLMYLRTIGRVYCIAEAVFSFQGSMPAVWALDPDFVAVPLQNDEDETVDNWPRRVIVRQQWEPHHARSPMDCLLFGVPKILQGTHA